MFLTLTKRSLYRLAVSVFVAVLFFSCQKEISTENGSAPVVTPPDLSTKIKSSVSGFVTDENGAPVLGASVQFGTSSTATDKYGYFEVRNVDVVKTAAFVTVNMPGYFKGIKTYMAEAGKTAFFRIKLIRKTTVGNINAATGGNITLAGGLSIALPAGAVVNAVTNVSYIGSINVAAYHISPEANDLNSIMPGDLRGINTGGALQLLKTYGMVAVELTGASGELLQIASGKTATISMPIPASLLADAPTSIPLWYFDETNGLWKEQGSAVKTGNAYIGDVSHFSYWNCDYPFNDAVHFDCTVVDASGNPVPGLRVDIYYGNGQYSGAHGTTDSSGYSGGLVPANTSLIVKIFSWQGGCYNVPLYSQPFTTTNVAVSLGNITIGSSSVATITGSLANCSGQPVTNGYVMLYLGNYYERHNVSTGNFSFSFPICGGNYNVNILGGDNVTQQESGFTNVTLVTGNNNVGSILACGNSNQEFFNYTINGTPYSLTPASASIMQYPDTMNINSMRLYAYANSGAYIDIGVSNAGIATGSSQNLSFVSTAQTGQTTIPSPIVVHITEYGAIGQFVSGNFSGTVTGFLPPNTSYTITGNFRIRRNF